MVKTKQIVKNTYDIEPQHWHGQVTEAADWSEGAQIIEMHVDLHFGGDGEWQAGFLLKKLLLLNFFLYIFRVRIER